MTENENETETDTNGNYCEIRPDVKIELYRGGARKPTATVDLDYPWIARQSSRMITERIATELADDLQKGEYRLFLIESGRIPISRRWESAVDRGEESRFRDLRRNVSEIVRDWRATQVSGKIA